MAAHDDRGTRRLTPQWTARFMRIVTRHGPARTRLGGDWCGDMSRHQSPPSSTHHRRVGREPTKIPLSDRFEVHRDVVAVLILGAAGSPIDNREVLGLSVKFQSQRFEPDPQGGYVPQRGS